MLFLAAIAITTFLILAAGVYLGWQGRKFLDRIEHLEEIAKRQRLPYPAADGLEDAMAMINDGRFQNSDVDRVISTLMAALQKSEATRTYMNTRFGQVLAVLQTVRSDPHTYDSDALNKKQEVL